MKDKTPKKQPKGRPLKFGEKMTNINVRVPISIKDECIEYIQEKKNKLVTDIDFEEGNG